MELEKQRKEMIGYLERIGYLKSPEVKKAMLKVKREEFVLPEYRERAYSNMPLPIPGNQTISAEHMHAISLETLKLKPGEKFLEVGAGSAIFLPYAKEIVGKKGKVFGIEFVKETYEFGKKNLKRTGYSNKVKLIHGDGSSGLPKEAPFDKILISAACPDIPTPLINQLKPGGKIVAIVGTPYGDQNLVCLEKTKDGKLKRKTLLPVIFVPLRGRYGFKY